MAYNIYDRESFNLVDSFPTEEEALAMVKRAIKEDGPESVESWVLGEMGFPEKALSGQSLIDRAMNVPA